MRIAVLLSHPLHDRNIICSGLAEFLRRRGHTVLPLIADRPRFRRLRQSLRLATMVAEEPRSQTYRHKATLRRGTRRFEAAYWRRVSRNGLDLVKAARRIEARLPVPSYIQEALRQTPPDLLLWPTLMHMDAVENDWIKVARTMGLPVLAAPASWDTLVSKGSWLAMPDRLIVWGEASRRHAVEVHGFAPEAVAAPGPPHFTPYEQGPIPPGKSVLVAGTSLHYWRDEDEIVTRLRRVTDVLHRQHPRRRGGWSPDVWSVRRDLEGAAFVIAAFSTVVIEAALLGRPSVLIGFGLGDQGGVLEHANYDHMREVAEWPSTFLARSELEMVARVWALIRNPMPEPAQRAIRTRALAIAHCTPGIQERIALAVEAAR